MGAKPEVLNHSRYDTIMVALYSKDAIAKNICKSKFYRSSPARVTSLCTRKRFMKGTMENIQQDLQPNQSVKVKGI